MLLIGTLRFHVHVGIPKYRWCERCMPLRRVVQVPHDPQRIHWCLQRLKGFGGMTFDFREDSLLDRRIHMRALIGKASQHLPVIVQMLDGRVRCAYLKRDLFQDVLEVLGGMADLLIQGFAANLLC